MVIHGSTGEAVDTVTVRGKEALLTADASTYSTDSERAYGKLSSADQSTAAGVIAGVAGKSIYIEKVVLSSAAAISIWVEDQDGNELIPKKYMAVNSNADLNYGDNPIVVPAGKAAMVQTSGAGAFTIEIFGYIR